MVKTENGYVLIQILQTELDREKMTGKNAEGYKVKVLLQTEDFTKDEELFVTKAGLISVDNRANTYVIHKDRVIGRF